MYKATAKDVKMLQKWGTNDKVVKYLIDTDAQPDAFLTGYFTPSQANWSWQIGIVSVDNKLYEVLLRFGTVEGGREIFISQYNTDGGYNLGATA